MNAIETSQIRFDPTFTKAIYTKKDKEDEWIELNQLSKTGHSVSDKQVSTTTLDERLISISDQSNTTESSYINDHDNKTPEENLPTVNKGSTNAEQCSENRQDISNTTEEPKITFEIEFKTANLKECDKPVVIGNIAQIAEKVSVKIDKIGTLTLTLTTDQIHKIKDNPNMDDSIHPESVDVEEEFFKKINIYSAPCYLSHSKVTDLGKIIPIKFKQSDSGLKQYYVDYHFDGQHHVKGQPLGKHNLYVVLRDKREINGIKVLKITGTKPAALFQNKENCNEGKIVSEFHSNPTNLNKTDKLETFRNLFCCCIKNRSVSQRSN